MIIVGQGALLARRRRRDPRAGRQDRDGAVRDGWNGFTVLHTAAARVGGLDLGFVPGAGRPRRRSHARPAAPTWSSISAPTKSTSRRGAFVIYMGTHGDRGAHRADVILPGAAYTEKSGTYVNTEAACRWPTAPASRRAKRARTGRSCARCRTCSARRCPSIRCALRAALYAAHPALRRARPDRAGRRGLAREPAAGRGSATGAFAPAVRGFLSDQSDRPRLRGHGRMLGAGAGAACNRRRSNGHGSWTRWVSVLHHRSARACC